MSAVAIAVVALAGLLVGVAPRSLPRYSVVVGYVGGQAAGTGRGIALSAALILGQATIDAAIGILFGFLGLAVIVGRQQVEVLRLPQRRHEPILAAYDRPPILDPGLGPDPAEARR
jgi:hypothetical protein